MYSNKIPELTGLLNDLHTQELRATLNDTNNPQQERMLSHTYCPTQGGTISGIKKRNVVNISTITYQTDDRVKSVSYTHLDVYKRQHYI